MADWQSGVLGRWLRRAVMTIAFQLMQLLWFVIRPQTFGVRAIVLSQQGRIVLIRHSYVPGWYLPGGGRRAEEAPRTAVVRELSEEIGLEGYDTIRPLGSYEHRPNYKHDRVDLFLIEGARYRRAPSFEIDDVREFPLEALPGDLSTRSRIDIARWRAASEGAA